MPTEVDVQARVIAGDGHQRPAGEEKEAEGARAAPARQKSAASAEWARRLEAEGDLQDRSVARSTAFAIGQRYFHGTLGRPSTRPLPPHHLLLRPDPPRRPRRQHHPCRHSSRIAFISALNLREQSCSSWLAASLRRARWCSWTSPRRTSR